MHPAGMHRPIVEAILKRDAESAAKAMERHTIEFGENLIKMEKAYREKNSMLPSFKLRSEKGVSENY
jgi:DNA-binding GntR family transcriptional regulator